MILWAVLLAVNVAFGSWGLIIYTHFTSNAPGCERAIRHVLLASGVAFCLAAFFVRNGKAPCLPHLT
jgi:hypothetical protein